jgi:hypothetical protein
MSLRDHLLPGLWSHPKARDADLEVSDQDGVVLVRPGNRMTLVAPDEMHNYRKLFGPRLTQIFSEEK